MIVPNLITTLDGKEVMVDFFTAEVTQNRTIHIIGEINDDTASYICSEIRYLSRNSKEPLTLILNSPGGSISAGMAIYDTMQYIKCDVSTICIGLAASMGAFLLAGGTKGKRYALPNAEVMIHQPSGGAKGQATEIQIAAEHILRTKQKLNEILAANTGQSLETIKADTERDNFMSADEAKAYGLIDEVIAKH